MAMTEEQVTNLEGIARELFSIAALFSPQVAGAAVSVEALLKLFKAGKEFNGFVNEIIEQTPENRDEVRAAAIAMYKASEENLQAALDAAREG
jgi:hypothetical protein